MGEKTRSDARHRVKYVFVATPVAMFACGATHACLPLVAEMNKLEIKFLNHVASLPKRIYLVDRSAECNFAH